MTVEELILCGDCAECDQCPVCCLANGSCYYEQDEEYTMTDGYTLIANETQTLREWLVQNGKPIVWCFFLTEDYHDCYYKSKDFTYRELNGLVDTVCERCGKYELTVEL